MKPNNLNLRHLRAFVAVAENESFIAASRQIGLSQPALSQSVRQLEAELGGRLFIRTTRSVHLTGIGLSFLVHARHVLRLVDQISAEMTGMIERRSGRIVVACLPSVAWRLMPAVMTESAALFPDIRIVMRDMSLRRIKQAVQEGDADVGIGGISGEMAAFSSRGILRDRMHVLFPRGHAFAAATEVSWADLARERSVGMTGETGISEIVNRAMEMAGAAANHEAEVSNLATLFGLVEQGFGIAAIPGLVVPRRDHPLLDCRPIAEPGVRRETALIWRRNSGMAPYAERLLRAFAAVRGAGTVDGEGTAFDWLAFDAATAPD